MKRGLFLLIVLIYAANTFAQGSLSVFDVDASNFPTMKAKFYAFDNAGNQQSPNPSDITITEDGITRTVLSVTCPPPTPSRPLSSVLVMDVSGSMSSDAGGKSRISIAQDVARLWVNAIPLSQSECAITSFDDANYLNQDFTTNRTRLLDAIQTIRAGNGTDYNMGLLEPLAGGLQISKIGKQQKIVVFLTDGLSDNVKTNEIIAEANRQNCIIYCVTIGLDCPQSLKDISELTGGRWYERIVSLSQITDVYIQILNNAQENLPCEVAWESSPSCKSGSRMIVMALNQINVRLQYTIPYSSIAGLTVNPEILSISSKPIGQRFDTLITITAINSSFNISNVISSNLLFDVSPKSFYLAKGQSQLLTVSYTPSDSGYEWTRFDFQTDFCPKSYYASGGYPGYKPKLHTLKVTTPNGGEEYMARNDTTITWTGIALTDTVRLEYSIDNGITWKIITNRATGGKYLWSIPSVRSDKCLVRVTQLSQTQGWVRKAGGSSYDISNAVAVDRQGNIFVTGAFRSTIDFDQLTLTSSGDYDIFLAKYRPNGIVEWAKRLGGNGSDIGKSIAVDSNGNIYVTGHFTGTADFDIDTLISSGESDIFIAKYHTDGSIEWVKKAGGGQSDAGNGIASDEFSNIYVTGYFRGNSDFADTVLPSIGGSTIFLSKYKLDGTQVWARSIGDSNDDGGNAVAIDKIGNIFVTGFYGKYYGRYDIYISKYHSDGLLEWEEREGWSPYFSGNCISINTQNIIYLGGTFENNVAFGSNLLSSSGETDVFTVKYQNDGSVDWAKRGGGQSFDVNNGIANDKQGNIYTTGAFQQKADFGGNDIQSLGDNDIFITKHRPDGSIEWVRNVGGVGNDVAKGIAVNEDDGVFITGHFYESVFFDSINLNTSGLSDIFVWKLTQLYELQSDTSDAVFSIVMPQYVSTDIDMGKVVVAKAKDSVITTFIRNTGTYPFRVDSIWLSGSGAFSLVSGIPPFDVPAGAARQVEFRFRPPSVGIHQAQITIKTQADTLQQSIRGEGVLPQVQAFGNVIDFGQVLYGMAKDTIINVAIQNIGTAPVNFTGDVQLGPDVIQYSVLVGGGAFTLQPNESRTVTLRFAPQFIGRTSGRVGFTHDAAGSPAILTLFGWGIGGEVYIPDDSAAPGEHKGIPILLGGIVTKNYSKLGAVKFKAEVEFNSSLLAPDGVVLPSVIDKGRRTLTIETSWDGSSDTLTMIPFIAALGDAETTTMNIPKFEWLDGFDAPLTLDVDTRSGTFYVSELCREGGTRLISMNGQFSLSEPIPNPSSSYATIRYDLIEEGQTELIITDVIGRKVQTLFCGEGKPGSYTIRVNTDELATGKYFYTLRTPTLHAMKMMLVEH